jgi:hypothetical protein
MNSWFICWFSRIFLLGILIFKGLTADVFISLSALKGYIQSITDITHDVLQC